MGGYDAEQWSCVRARRGGWPFLCIILVQMNTFDARVTPALCAAARKNIPALGERWRRQDWGANPDHYIGPMRFLVNNGCACQQELAALDVVARRKPDSLAKENFMGRLAPLLKSGQ